MTETDKQTTVDTSVLSYNLSGTTGGTWVPFADAVDFQPNKVSIGVVPTVKLASTCKTSQPAKTPDYGEVQVTIWYTAANVALINGWIDGAIVAGFQFTVADFTTPSQQVFLGHVTEFQPIAGMMKRAEGEDAIAVSKFTIKVCSKPTFTAGHNTP